MTATSTYTSKLTAGHRVVRTIAAAKPMPQRLAAQENVRLEPRAGLSLRDAAGTEIACMVGSIWLTMEGDSRDIALTAGDAYTLERNGLTLVSALESSVVNVRSVWDSGYARWPRWLQHVASWLVRTGEARARRHVLSRYY